LLDFSYFCIFNRQRDSTGLEGHKVRDKLKELEGHNRLKELDMGKVVNTRKKLFE
jgi:hypothetical protein